MRNSLTTIFRFGIFFIIALTVLGCKTASPPTDCSGPYTWAYGTVSPEFIKQLQDAMIGAGLEGSAQASTYGENDGCGEFHAKDVDYVFTLRVKSLEESADLASTASVILDIATRSVNASPAPNLGKLQLIFQAKGQQCTWFYENGAWDSDVTGADNFISCPVPTSAASQRLADALTGLSSDLACEISTLTANTSQAVLECERAEGNDRYIVTVTLSLKGQAYDGVCFHGYKAFESSSTGNTPMTVTEGGNSYFERDRSFQWRASGVLYDLFERIQGGQDVTLPSDTREQVYARALQDGLISGEGQDCP